MMNLNGTPLGLCGCGRHIYADVQKMAVIHELPFCKEFKDLDPKEFLAHVRKARGL